MTEEVTLMLTRDEAVVFFEWLAKALRNTMAVDGNGRQIWRCTSTRMIAATIVSS